MTLERWDIGECSNCNGGCDTDMESAEDGEYVLASEADAELTILRQQLAEREAQLWYVLPAFWGDRGIEIEHEDDGETIMLIVSDYDGKPERRYDCGESNAGVLRAIDKARSGEGEG